MLRFATYLIPALTATLVAVAVVWLGAPRTLLAARVLGGAAVPEGQALIVEVVRLRDTVEKPVPGTPVQVQVAAVAARGTTDGAGLAHVFVREPGPDIVVTSAGTLLARGELEPAAPPSPGDDPVLRGTTDGPLRVRVALRQGAAASGLPAPLEVLVRRDDTAVAGAPVIVLPTRELAATVPRPTDAEGVTHLDVTVPLRRARLALRVGEGMSTTTWRGEVPALAGARPARLRDGTVEVLDPDGTDRLHVAVVTLRGRHETLTVAPMAQLVGGPSWRPVSLVRPLPSAATWVATGRDPLLDGDASPGWPIRTAAVVDDAPRPTVDAPARVLLDGVVEARAAERRRLTGVHRMAATLALVNGVALAIIMLLRVTRESGGSDAVTPYFGPGWRRVAELIVASLLVLAGVLTLALFAWYQR